MTEIEGEIYQALRERDEAVYLIDKVNRVYEPIKTTPFWEAFFGSDRSLHNFVSCIYTRNAEQGNMKFLSMKPFLKRKDIRGAWLFLQDRKKRHTFINW